MGLTATLYHGSSSDEKSSRAGVCACLSGMDEHEKGAQAQTDRALALDVYNANRALGVMPVS